MLVKHNAQIEIIFKTGRKIIERSIVPANLVDACDCDECEGKY